MKYISITHSNQQNKHFLFIMIRFFLQTFRYLQVSVQFYPRRSTTTVICLLDQEWMLCCEDTKWKLILKSQMHHIALKKLERLPWLNFNSSVKTLQSFQGTSEQLSFQLWPIWVRIHGHRSGSKMLVDFFSICVFFLGGLVGLFTGMSVLSLFEMLFWLYRLTEEIISSLRLKSNKSILKKRVALGH